MSHDIGFRGGKKPSPFEGSSTLEIVNLINQIVDEMIHDQDSELHKKIMEEYYKKKQQKEME